MNRLIDWNRIGERQGLIVFFKVSYGFILEDDEFQTQWFFHVSNVLPGFKPEVGKRVVFFPAPPIRLGQRFQAVKVEAEPPTPVITNEPTAEGFTAVAETGGKAGL